jgi:hypothetical protein
VHRVPSTWWVCPATYSDHRVICDPLAVQVTVVGGARDSRACCPYCGDSDKTDLAEAISTRCSAGAQASVCNFMCRADTAAPAIHDSMNRMALFSETGLDCAEPHARCSNCSTENGDWPHLIAVSILKVLQFSGKATARSALTAACSTVELLRTSAF